MLMSIYKKTKTGSKQFRKNFYQFMNELIEKLGKQIESWNKFRENNLSEKEMIERISVLNGNKGGLLTFVRMSKLLSKLLRFINKAINAILRAFWKTWLYNDGWNILHHISNSIVRKSRNKFESYQW